MPAANRSQMFRPPLRDDHYKGEPPFHVRRYVPVPAGAAAMMLQEQPWHLYATEADRLVPVVRLVADEAHVRMAITADVDDQLRAHRAQAMAAAVEADPFAGLS